MTFELYYYLFSVATVYIFVFHLWNTIFLRLKGKNLIGKTFKKGTSEYESIEKYISQRAINIFITALLLSLVNLVFAVREVLLSFNAQRAVAVLIIFAFLALAIIVGIVLILRSYYGDNTGQHSAAKQSDDEDDW